MRLFPRLALEQNSIAIKAANMTARSIHQDIKVWDAQGEMKSNLEERKNTFVNQTLGNVAKHFVENWFTTPEQGDDNKRVSDEASKFSMSFTRGPMLCDEDFYNQRKNELTALIAERNDLIHHFLPKWNFGDYESVKAAEQYLDKQRERVFPEFELLKSIAQNFHEGGKQLAEYLTSDEGWKELELSPLRDSRHIAWLVVFAIQRKRDNGWAVLDAARVFIHQNVDESWLADELTWIKKDMDVKHLGKLLKNLNILRFVRSQPIRVEFEFSIESNQAWNSIFSNRLT